jgi:hypothetical protein
MRGGGFFILGGMRKVLAGLGLLVAVFLVAGSAAEGRAKAKKAAAKPGADVAECHEDTDCVLVTDGCCGCNEGGKQRAIPRRARDAYEKKRGALCKNTMCPQLMSEDPSCVGRAVCQQKDKARTCALAQ